MASGSAPDARAARRGEDRSAMTVTEQQTAVQPFTQLSRADVPFAGGKGANLGEMTRAGLPVPPGFVVGAPAYASFCAESGVLDRLDVDDTAALEAAAGEAKSMVAATPMSEWLAAAIGRAYDELAGGDDDV